MLSKKHFISLADALRGKKITGEALDALCAWCRRENSAFKEERFRAYLAGECGPNGGKKK